MGALLNHVVIGADRALALLLIHPLGADLTFWDDFVAILDGRITTVACDLRGVGNSPALTCPQGIDAQAGDLDALRAAIGIESLVVVGCAIGSMTAAAYAGNFPERTRALVMANPTPRTYAQAAAVLAERAALVRAEGIGAILPGAVARAFHNLPLDERYHRYLGRFSTQDPEAYALATLSAAGADANRHLGRLQCPTLLVPGRHDVLLPLTNAEAVLELVPSAHLVVMEEAAHFGPYQQPARFAELVLDFIAEKILRARPNQPSEGAP